MQSRFRKRLRHLCHSATAVMLFTAASVAQEKSFELNASTTTVSFTLGDVLHVVRGRFKPKSGSIHFDSSSGVATGGFIVDATSGESGNATRDRKMNKEILESNRYPEISFSPTKITGNVANGSSVQVDGIFHIHGADHPITLTVPLALNGDELTAKFHFLIPYVAWGMKNPSTFILRVGKEVDIDVVAVGRLIPSQ